jgi:VCBS repeat-containing protein
MEQKLVLSVLVMTVLIASTFLVSAAVTGKNPVDYISSIHVSDLGNDNSAGISEVQESAQLAPLAKITAEEAKTIALNQVTGNVGQVSLENENGNLVYSVEISNNQKSSDVKVDAGNGKVLHVESGADNEKTSSETEASTESENIQDNETDGINHEFDGDEGNHED